MRLLIALLLLASSSPAATAFRESRYYWEAKPVGNTAELLTLFCRSCRVEAGAMQNIPLISVLRDTLGDSDPENDRISSVWLLPYTTPSVKQTIFSGIPFLWTQLGKSSRFSTRNTPLTDLTHPEYPMLGALERTILQLTVLDRSTMLFRAVSRAYAANQLDNERLHLEEAITYFEAAPVSESGPALTQKQVDTIVARLELRKSILGGFVTESGATHVGEQSRFERERVRDRNWELLRQCAEKTGLLFEPLDIAGTVHHYGMLWFPLDSSPRSDGSSLCSIWKLLNIKDPWMDHRLQHWSGVTFSRSLSEEGSLLPVGVSGVKNVTLVPLCIYSLTYSKTPLLLIDFRDKSHVWRHEVTQRAITEITAGVIGLSHFTNWYYYLGMGVYEFVAARHGSAVDQSARLDSYSQFRVDLASDQDLDASLRKELQPRVGSLIVNPLIEPASQQMNLASGHYAVLQAETDVNGKVGVKLDEERRSEAASFGETTRNRITRGLLHEVTFGLYNGRVNSGAADIPKLDRYRRIEYQLTFLNQVIKTGGQPEHSNAGTQLRASVAELSSLITAVDPVNVRAHVAGTLKRLGDLSQDTELQANCRFAVASLNASSRQTHSGSGMVASTRLTGNRPPLKSVESVR